MTVRTAMRTTKKQYVKISKTTTLQVHHTFLYISLPFCPISRFLEDITQDNNFPFFYSKLRYSPLEFIS